MEVRGAHVHVALVEVRGAPVEVAHELGERRHRRGVALPVAADDGLARHASHSANTGRRDAPEGLGGHVEGGLDVRDKFYTYAREKKKRGGNDEKVRSWWSMRGIHTYATNTPREGGQLVRQRGGAPCQRTIFCEVSTTTLQLKVPPRIFTSDTTDVQVATQ